MTVYNLRTGEYFTKQGLFHEVLMSNFRGVCVLCFFAEMKAEVRSLNYNLTVHNRAFLPHG